MNLYLIERDDNASYDEYVSAIVCAESEEEAVKIHPNGDIFDTVCRWGSEWVKDPSHVECKKIGVADESIEKGGFPRRCGGDPPKADVTKLMKEFSPQVRG